MEVVQTRPVAATMSYVPGVSRGVDGIHVGEVDVEAVVRPDRGEEDRVGGGPRCRVAPTRRGEPMRTAIEDLTERCLVFDPVNSFA
jgi:hypothetical protein